VSRLSMLPNKALQRTAHKGRAAAELSR